MPTKVARGWHCDRSPVFQFPVLDVYCVGDDDCIGFTKLRSTSGIIVDPPPTAVDIRVYIILLCFTVSRKHNFSLPFHFFLPNHHFKSWISGILRLNYPFYFFLQFLKNHIYLIISTVGRSGKWKYIPYILKM